MNYKERVREALDYTREKMPEHFFNLFRAHAELDGGVGAVYPLSCDELDRALRSRAWMPATFSDDRREVYGMQHMEVALQADMSGHLGIVPVWFHHVAPSAIYTASDPKKTGRFKLVVERRYVLEDISPITTIILKREQSGKETVVDFYTGHPIDRNLYVFTPPSGKGLHHGDQLTPAELESLKEVRYARVV